MQVVVLEDQRMLTVTDTEVGQVADQAVVGLLVVMVLLVQVTLEAVVVVEVKQEMDMEQEEDRE